MTAQHPHRVRMAVVPTAGLGTRLLPASLAVPKELLPLGRWPALVHVLLEAVAAHVEEMAVVVSPDKGGVRHLLDPSSWGSYAGHPAVEPLAALLKMVHVRVVEQPQPWGVLDAIERGRRALGPGSCAVLFPDLVHLPDQTGLRALLAAHARSGGETIFGLHDAGAAAPGLHGPSAGVVLSLDEDSDTDLDHPFAPLVPRKIAELEAPGAAPRSGDVRTTFGFIHTAAYSEALGLLARPEPDAPLDDSKNLEALGRLADQGKLFGTFLPGEVVDLGVAPGYLEAVRRFAAGTAAWRDLG